MNGVQSPALKPAGGLSEIKKILRQLQRVIWNVSHLIVLTSGLQQKSDVNEKWQDSKFQKIDEEAAL